MPPYSQLTESHQELVMTGVKIYTTTFCLFYDRENALLKRKGVSYPEIDVMMMPGTRAELRKPSDSGNKVSQILINGKHVGRSDVPYALEEAGGLNSKLSIGA